MSDGSSHRYTSDGASRRHLLGVLAAVGAGGCLGLGDSGDVSADDVGFAVEVDGEATAEHPPRLTVAVTNRSDEPWTYPVWPPDAGRRVPFDDFTAEREGGAGRMHLIPDFDRYMGPQGGDGSLIPADRIDGCWQAGYDHVITADIAPQQATLAPDESFTETYTVVDGSDGTCRPAGTYPFGVEKHVTVDDRELVVGLRFDVKVGTDGAVSTAVESPTVEHRSTTDS